jgi:Phosphatidylinositol-specific phospholipase C, X domain
MSSAVLLSILCLLPITHSSKQNLRKHEDSAISVCPVFSRYPDDFTLAQVNLIPGTHNAGTFDMTKPENCKIEEPYPFLRRSWVASRCKTQTFSIEDQLNMGIRFFDLRSSPVDGDAGEYMITHNLYTSLKLTDVLNTITDWLAKNSKEIVLVFIRRDSEHSDLITSDSQQARFGKVIADTVAGKALENTTGSLMNIPLGEMRGKIILLHQEPFMKHCFRSDEMSACQSFHIGQSFHMQSLYSHGYFGHSNAIKDIENYCSLDTYCSAIVRPVKNPDPNDLVMRMLSVDNSWIWSIIPPLSTCEGYNNCLEKQIKKKKHEIDERIAETSGLEGPLFSRHIYLGVVAMDGVTPELIQRLVTYVSPEDRK